MSCRTLNSSVEPGDSDGGGCEDEFLDSKRDALTGDFKEYSLAIIPFMQRHDDVSLKESKNINDYEIKDGSAGILKEDVIGSDSFVEPISVEPLAVISQGANLNVGSLFIPEALALQLGEFAATQNI